MFEINLWRGKLLIKQIIRIVQLFFMENKYITKASVSALILGLILGFASGSYWSKAKTEKVSENSGDQSGDKMMVDNNAPDSSMAGTNEGQTVHTDTVSDQSIINASNQKAGDSVLVSKVVTNTEIWVAVREDVEGELGNILGARRIDAGTTENIVVLLLRSTVPDTKYHVVLYRENGDGVFDNKTDTLLETGGRIIESSFVTFPE